MLSSPRLNPAPHRSLSLFALTLSRLRAHGSGITLRGHSPEVNHDESSCFRVSGRGFTQLESLVPERVESALDRLRPLLEIP
eukprot:1637130-Rhodomonas_salina.1